MVPCIQETQVRAVRQPPESFSSSHSLKTPSAMVRRVGSDEEVGKLTVFCDGNNTENIVPYLPSTAEITDVQQ